MIDVFFETEPEFDEVVRDFKDDFVDLKRDLMQEIADDAPFQMQSLMGSDPPSSPGEAPAMRSRELHDSIEGVVTGENEVEIEMAYHGFYLDPFFLGAGKGGGRLNRPFVEPGIQKTFDKL